MADITISKFTTQVLRQGSTPASPGFAVDEGQNPTDPSGNPPTHLPVTIGSPANGLAVTEAQVLTIDKAQIFSGTSSQFVKGDGTLDSTAYGTGSVTSVGLSMPSAFNVASSPVTTSGTIAVTAAGNATQYVRGDGVLATLPTSGEGGGASVSYYLNGSVNQGTIGGVTYYEMNKTPIIGAGTDFTRNSNGYIASFLTDANDPSLLVIPAGNWNFETYFEASSGGGSPTFYLELYKYDGTTFTLVASNSGTPKLINDGTSIEAYFSALAVPQTTLTLTDRLAIRIYVSTAGRTLTLHTENNTLCQVITTFTTGLSALNGLTSQVQFFAVGTSGTNFNIASATDTHTFNLPTASATNRGALASADWSTFNNKQNQLNGTGFVKASGTTITYDNSTYQVTSEKAQPNGYASLDSNGKVPLVQINDALIGNVNFQGLWNAATNNPTLANPPASGTKGYYYIVSTAGTFASISFEVGDWIISNGTAWGKVDNTDAVSSVFGRTGNVTASNGDYNTSQVTELTNLYYTEARVNANANVAANTAARHNAVTLGTANGLSLSTQVLSLQLATSGQNGALSSTDWSTFNNKENAITAGTTAQYFRGDKTFQTLNTSVVPESGNLYFTQARVSANTDVAANTAARHNAVTLGTANGLSLSTQQLSLGLASAGVTGALSGTDWSTFNSKQQALNGTGFVKISGTTISYDNTSYLPLTGGTLTGALFGTTASFSGQITGPSAGVEGKLNFLGYNNAYGGIVSNTGFSSAYNGVVLYSNFNLARSGQGNTSLPSWILDLGGSIPEQDAFSVLRSPSGSFTFATLFKLSAGGAGSFSNSLTATSFIRNGGTSSQFLKADGSVDSNAYITGNQTITLSGVVTGSGTTAITTAIANGAITNAMLANSSFFVGTTSISLGRASAAQTLTGVSIDGNAETVGTIAANRIVYGGLGSRQGVNLITDWNQSLFADAAFLSSESATTNAPSTDFSYGVQTSFHRSGPDYRTQFVTSLYGNNVYWLRQLRDSAGWSSWVQILHSGNFNSYAPTLLGVGASGTWSIAINGNAATANTWTTARTLTIGATGKSVNGSANVAWSLAEIGAYAATNPSAFIALTALSGTAPIEYNNTTGAISITQASGSTNGFLSSTDWTTFNNKTSNVGTVTSVAALTIGTTGTDLSSSVANGTTTPVITLNVPTASAANRGALSAADWTTFNGKENAITAGTTAQYYRGDKTFQTLNTAAVPELTNLYYTEARVSANTDVAANTAARHAAVTLGTTNGLGLTGQQLSLGLASSSANGALSSTDWTTFNNKQNALTNPVTGTGTANYLPKFTGTSTIGNSNIVQSGIYSSFGTTATHGNVTINQTTGEAGLVVNSIIAETPTLYLRDAGGSGYSRILANNNLVLDASKVLIGTTTDAGFKLDVNGTGRFSGQLRAVGLRSEATNGYMLYMAPPTGDNIVLYDDAANTRYGFFNETDGRLDLMFSKATGAATFSSSSGIGLTVLGTAAAQNLSATTGYARFYQAGGFANVNIGALTSGSFAGWIQVSDGVGTQIPLSLQPGGGNVLIGTTTDAGFRLDVNGTGRFSNTLETTSAGSERHIRMLSYNNTYSSIRTNTGFNSNYNSFTIIANSNSNDSGQGNTGLPSWILDLGGNLPNSDSFNIGRSSAGSFSFSNLFKLSSTGAGEFTSSVTATSIIRSGGTSSQYLMADGSVSTLTNPVTGTGTAGQVAYWSSGSAITGESNLFWDATNDRLGIGRNNPSQRLDILGSGTVYANIENSGANIAAVITKNTSKTFTTGLVTDYWAVIDATSGSNTRLIITSGGNVLINTFTDVTDARLNVNGNIRTQNPLGGTAANWSLGTARGGTVTTNATVRVMIDGVLVDLVARYV